MSVIDYKHNQLLLIESAPTYEEYFFYYKKDRMIVELQRSIFPSLENVTLSDKAIYLNETFEVNFYHYFDDVTYTDMRMHISPEEYQDARVGLQQYLQKTQPMLAVFSSERLAKKHFKLNYSVENVFKTINWSNTGRTTECFVLPSTRAQNRVDVSSSFDQLNEKIKQLELDLE